jgi:DNA polymerase III delta subunit
VITLLCGASNVLVNQERDTLVGSWNQPVERIDVGEDGVGRLVELLASPSLFGEVRYGVVDGVEGLEGALEVLETYAGASSAVVVVCWRASVRGNVKKRLEAIGTVVSVSVPVRGEVETRVTAMAARAGVTLTHEGVLVLTGHLGEDWGRVRGILSQLGSSGLTNPSPAMLVTLCGSGGGGAMVWDVTDALGAGNLREALCLVGKCEPVVLANWIGKETLLMARAHEGGWSAAQVESELELTPFRARKIAKGARVARDWGAALAAAGDLDIAAKSGDPVLMLAGFARWATLTK